MQPPPPERVEDGEASEASDVESGSSSSEYGSEGSSFRDPDASDSELSSSELVGCESASDDEAVSSPQAGGGDASPGGVLTPPQPISISVRRTTISDRLGNLGLHARLPPFHDCQPDAFRDWQAAACGESAKPRSGRQQQRGSCVRRGESSCSDACGGTCGGARLARRACIGGECDNTCDLNLSAVSPANNSSDRCGAGRAGARSSG